MSLRVSSIPGVIRLNVLKETPGFADFVINSRQFCIIFDQLSFDRELLIDHKKHHIIILAPITCTDKIQFNAKTVFVLNKVEAAAGIVFNCSTKVVSFVDLPANTDASIPFSKCQIVNEDLKSILRHLDCIREPQPNMKEIFKGIMKCWEYQLAEDDVCRYADAFKFFSIKPTFDRTTEVIDPHYYSLDRSKVPSSDHIDLPNNLATHIINCDYCLEVYVGISDIAKEMLSLRYKLETFSIEFGNLNKDSKLPNSYLEFRGILEPCDLKKPMIDFPTYYSHAEICILLEAARARLVQKIAGTSEEDMDRFNHISKHFLASKPN